MGKAIFFVKGSLLIFERFFYHSTIPVGLYQIFAYIWSISLCKFTKLQESEMGPTGWTLSYVMWYLQHPLNLISPQCSTLLLRSTRLKSPWLGLVKKSRADWRLCKQTGGLKWCLQRVFSEIVCILDMKLFVSHSICPFQ